jgi:hypothetical protein
VHIDSPRTPIKKNINLKQISFYWEEDTAVHVLALDHDKRAGILRNIIDRQEHRLLTLDGTLLMEKNKEDFDYFFSTSFRVLEVQTNYQQLKQIIQVTQAFINARKKKKFIKIKELKHEAQLQLQPQFMTHFEFLFNSRFEEANEQCIRLIESVDRKLLMKWTKTHTVELLRREKLRSATEAKNRKGWLNFLSRNLPTALTEEEIELIEQELSQFIDLVENSNNLSAGVYLFVKSVHLMMDHSKVKQRLFFLAEGIDLKLSRKEHALRAGLHVLDTALTYRDTKKGSEVAIFKKNASPSAKLVQLEVLNSKTEQRLDLQLESVSITHEVQFLGFVS